jgi:hypothetical protein
VIILFGLAFWSSQSIEQSSHGVPQVAELLTWWQSSILFTSLSMEQSGRIHLDQFWRFDLAAIRAGELSVTCPDVACGSMIEAFKGVISPKPPPVLARSRFWAGPTSPDHPVFPRAESQHFALLPQAVLGPSALVDCATTHEHSVSPKVEMTVDGTQGADSPGGAPNTFPHPRASACSDGGVPTLFDKGF